MNQPGRPSRTGITGSHKATASELRSSAENTPCSRRLGHDSEAMSAQGSIHQEPRGFLTYPRQIFLLCRLISRFQRILSSSPSNSAARRSYSSLRNSRRRVPSVGSWSTAFGFVLTKSSKRWSIASHNCQFPIPNHNSQSLWS